MKNARLVQITILFMAFIQNSDQIVISSIVKIYAQFPNAGVFVKAFLLSGSMLVSIPAALICGKLVQYFSKKTLLIVAYLIYLLAGVGAAFVSDIYSLAIARGLVGIAFGAFGAAGYGLIAELFEDENARAAMVGRVNAVLAASAITFAALSGYISTFEWHQAFFLNAIGLPILLMIVAFLPRTPPEKFRRIRDDAAQRQRFPYAKVLPLCIVAFVFNGLFMIIYFHVAVYVEERSLGGPGTAGMLSSVLAVGSFLASMLFDSHYRTFSRFTPVVFFTGVSLCFFILSMKLGIYWVTFVIALSGWAYGLSYCYFCLKATTLVPHGVTSLSAGFLNASISLATYLSPFALSLFKLLFGVDTVAGALFYIAVTMLAGAVVAAVLGLQNEWRRDQSQVRDSIQ